MADPDLDPWLPNPAVRVAHARSANADREHLWEAAKSVRLDQTRLLGRLVRWRIPGVPPRTSFEHLFSHPPFSVLEDEDFVLLSGLVGRIWTLRRDYPRLSGPEDYRDWDQAGTAKVLFANWVQTESHGRAKLRSETRVQAYGVQGRVGLASVRPLIATFHQLVSTDAMAVAVRAAESG